VAISFFEQCLANNFAGDMAVKIYQGSLLLQYLKKKTGSVSLSPKSRANLGNLYAIYVLVEDYIKEGFDKSGKYSNYNGASFSDLFNRQRQLPFGSKLQNHALNHRCNQEFIKFFPRCGEPITRDTKTQKYWINEKMLLIKMNSSETNIASVVIEIIDKYIGKRSEKYNEILKKCDDLKNEKDEDIIIHFIESLVSPTSDARTFEIISFVILKNYFEIESVWFGKSKSNINNETLQLFKTGRTNANDGGIDFVMKPLGRFFQVTEDIDLKKFFLDIEKINRFPITFVIKSTKNEKELIKKIEEKAKSEYEPQIVKKYMGAIEEIISLPELLERLHVVVKKDKIANLLTDLEAYFKVEFDIK